jgi:hypothetical protein
MPDFSLLSTPNFAQSALAGFQAGQEQRRERDTQAALRGYIENPQDRAALTGLAVNAPQIGIPLMNQQRERDEQDIVGELAARASQGDAEAARELWKRDPRLADKLDDNHREQLKVGMEAIGNAALRLSVLPDDQIPIAADQAIDALASRFPELAKFKGRVRTRQDLDSVLDQTGMTEKAIEMRRTKWVARPGEGGALIPTDYLGNVIGGADANTPAPSPIEPGAVINGKRFKGGDYRDPANWESGGSTPAASGNFP